MHYGNNEHWSHDQHHAVIEGLKADAEATAISHAEAQAQWEAEKAEMQAAN
ncbi:MAG: hypothetical protein GY928_27560 [Colwellia sp.]|nr:hypothetical protein [Colwellia sp.]